MRASIIGRTFEVDKEGNPITSGNTRRDFETLSGKEAGICYSKENYLSDEIQKTDNALKRAAFTAKNGHLSVFEHCSINLILETNKAIAMVLNSLGVYTTSEKSARYTTMVPQTDKEAELYKKWLGILHKEILKQYPDIDDIVLSKKMCKKMGVDYSKIIVNGSISQIKEDEWLEEELRVEKSSKELPSYKLAQENARYMLSVFTPTVMGYTISYRQMFRICDLVENYLTNGNDRTSFGEKLRPHLEDLVKTFKELLPSSLYKEDIQLNDNKNQYIRFIEAGIGVQAERNLVGKLTEKVSTFGDSYTAVYNGSLAMLAQAQRHRTLKYTMYLDKAEQFYIPCIIREAGLTAEWLSDISSIADVFPQGTLVRITEQGTFEDFALKCKERLCGRAQLEIAKSTEALVKNFYCNRKNLSFINRETIESMYDSNNDRVKARCEYKDFTCVEGCRWNSKEALTRKI